MRAIQVLLLLAFSGIAAADEEPAFPDALGELEHADFMNFEQTTPGAGYGHNYAAPNVIATVYLYTRGMTIPASVDDEFFRQELMRTRNEFQAAAAQLKYTDLQFAEFGRFASVGNHRCLSMLAGFVSESKPHLSLTCVMPFDHRILKVRYTFQMADVPAQSAQLRAFLAALAELLIAQKPATDTE